MLYVLLFLAGILSGTITGLIPGLHINLIAALIISSNIKGEIILYYLVPLAITHTFLDFIPSFFLGAPSEETALATLPGHKLLLKGEGLKAIKFAALGALYGILFSLILLFFFIRFIETFKPSLSLLILLVLCAVLILMIFSEKKKLWAIFLIVGSGTLGYFSLNYYSGIFPLITGFFGLSSLIFSFLTEPEIPEQDKGYVELNTEIIYNSFLGSIFSPIIAIFPALSTSQVAFIAEKFFLFTNSAYLALIGSISSSGMLYSFATLFFLNKARTGVAATLKTKVSLALPNFYLTLILVIISAIFAYLLVQILAYYFLDFIKKFDYKTLNLSIIFLIIVLVFMLNSFSGLVILALSTLLGYLTIRLNLRRSINMSCLLIPTLSFYIRLLF